MALPVALLFLNILNFVTAMLVISYFYQSRNLASVRWMLGLVVSFCVISFCTLGTYMSRELEPQILFSRMRFLTLGLLPPIWFLFIASLYSRWNWMKRPWFAAAISAPGLITTLFTIVPAWREFIIRDFEPITVNGFSVLKYSTGWWFPVHYNWAMLLVFASLCLGAFFFFKESGVRRRQIVLLLACSTLAAGVDIYCVLTDSPLRWLLLSSGTFLFSQIGIVIAALKLHLLNIVPLAMNRVFHEFPDPVFVLDAESRIRAVNKMATAFFGQQRLVGLAFSQTFPNIDPLKPELEIKDSRGESHFFKPSVETLLSAAGEISGRIIVLREITMQKKIERRLNENLEFKARLLSMIAHDLSGFLQTQSYLSSSLNNQAGPELKPQTKILMDSAFASKDFMANILPWVRSQENQFRPVVKPFEMGILLKELINNLESLWRVRDLKINLTEQGPVIVEGDSIMIESVIRNILTNAIRASSPGQTIDIALEQIKKADGTNEVLVRVKDSGVGMSPRQLDSIRSPSDKIFEDSDLRSNGFGLGLTIAKRFVDLHAGQLDFVSEEGRGTSVTLTLPS